MVVNSMASSLIAAVPEAVTTVTSLNDISLAFDRTMLATDNTVELNVPLNTPLRIAQLTFDAAYTLAELTNASPEPIFSGVSDSTFFSREDGATTVSINLAPITVPAVTSTSPASGETGVAYTPMIGITFNKAIDPGTLVPNVSDTTCTGSVQLSADNFVSCIPFAAASVAVSADGTAFSASPLAHLLNNTLYQLKITSDITDLYGTNMPNDYIPTSGFTTYNFYENSIPSASGTLDASFGTGGKLVRDIGGSDSAEDIAISDDGNNLILISNSGQDPMVWKVDNLGGDVTSFGTSGSFNTAVGGSAISGTGFTIGLDQNIYISGMVGFYNIRVWSYTAEGTANTAFNGSAYLTTDARGYYGWSIETYPDGDLLVGGHSNSDEPVLLKLRPDGSYDTAFGTDGYASFNNPPASNDVNDVLVDAYGRILVCGKSGAVYPQESMAIWRINADGTPDTSFSDDGIVTHNNAAGNPADDKSDICYAMAFDESGNIFAVGHSYSSDTNIDLIVWKYLPDGTLDTEFGTNGFFQYDGGNNDGGSDLAIDGSGKIVVVGYRSNGVDDDLLILRLNPDGSPDSDFATGGFITEHSLAGGGAADRGKAVRLMETGEIMVGGNSHNGSDNDAVVLKYQ